MERKLLAATYVAAVTMLLVVHGCHSQSESVAETESDIAKAMVNEEGQPWWDPTANTILQTRDGDAVFLNLGGGDREKRAAVRNRLYLWTNGIVPFTISQSFSTAQRITIIESMKHWENKTCIRFSPRTNHRDYVTFYRGGGCSSYIGRIRGQQGISLGAYCVVPSVVIHEIGHAVGFFHEQSRPDRNDYIRIINANIQPGAESQFRIESESRVNSLGVGYDYNSIMHYDPNTFARRGRIAIQALAPGITVGNAEELSPLDILQTQLLYRCSQIGNRPSQLVVPPTPPLGLPSGIQCGRVFRQISGSFESPGYPSFRHNQRCAWVISAPEGYDLYIIVRGLSVDQSSGCTRDYIQFHRGRTMGNPIRYPGYIEGRYCDRLSYYQSITFRIGTNEAVMYFQTDGRNSQNGLQGFRASFEARDINECRFSGCDNCVNTPGSFECTCNDGFYLSPAAERCFDVNECAIQNGGCEHTCVNRAGYYRCQCNSGFLLQRDGKSCRRPGDEIPDTPVPTVLPPTTPPPPTCGGRLTAASGFLQSPNWPQTYPVNFECEWTIELPNSNSRIRLSFDDQAFGLAGQISNCNMDTLTIYDGDIVIRTLCDVIIPHDIVTTSNTAKIVFIAGPAHSPARLGFRINYNSIAPPTTQPPTTQPPTQGECGGRLTDADNELQSPNWPETYNVNEICEWTIELADATSRIIMAFEDQNFGIAGSMPLCSKDVLEIFDGLGSNAARYVICGIILPGHITTTSNTARIVFTAGPSHGAIRNKGFKLDYDIISAPSTEAPTTIPTTNATTQPPTTTPTTEATTPTTEATTPPTEATTSTTEATTPTTEATTPTTEATTPTTEATTEATTPTTEATTPSEIVTQPTSPTTTTTTQPPTPTFIIEQTSPGCDGYVTIEGNRIVKSPNWPATYPVNMICDWKITVSDPNRHMQIVFDDHFGIAGRLSRNCNKDTVVVYDGHESNDQLFGTYCEFTVPPTLRTSSNKARIILTSLGKHSDLRVGFQATMNIV